MNDNMTSFYENFKRLSTKSKLVAIPFLICALFLLFTGKVFRLSYKEFSVVFNLWIQGAVLMVSSFLPLGACVVTLTKGMTVPVVLMALFFLVYAIINVWAFVGMLRHYGKDKDYAFDLCVYDLEKIATSWGMSYHMVNLLIFILFYLVIIGINVMLAHYVFITNYQV